MKKHNSLDLQPLFRDLYTKYDMTTERISSDRGAVVEFTRGGIDDSCRV
jgi:hypothetical protein